MVINTQILYIIIECHNFPFASKMSVKILQLWLVLGSPFKELVEFSRSSSAQLLKLRLLTKPSVKQIF